MENQYENYRGFNADDNALDKFKKNEFSLSIHIFCFRSHSDEKNKF